MANMVWIKPQCLKELTRGSFENAAAWVPLLKDRALIETVAGAGQNPDTSLQGFEEF